LDQHHDQATGRLVDLVLVTHTPRFPAPAHPRASQVPAAVDIISGTTWIGMRQDRAGLISERYRHRMPDITRSSLLDPQTPLDWLLLVLVVCSGPGALILLWLYFQDWRAQRKAPSPN
jgi:hypothetical protein